VRQGGSCSGGDGGSNPTNAQFKAIQNLHNESPYTSILKMKKSLKIRKLVIITLKKKLEYTAFTFIQSHLRKCHDITSIGYNILNQVMVNLWLVLPPYLSELLQPLLSGRGLFLIACGLCLRSISTPFFRTHCQSNILVILHFLSWVKTAL
jgi:hypothetical protein